ncbi:DNA polymerase I [bacterium 210820-DFI.6.52]|uniref:DNA polymerase I n=3 Tax=Eubacteriales TaxID=186802 RepID=A0AAQ1RWS0_9FIRM|nr:DNA polymerase I [Bittarella massiliensis (ex Durand et al. 2017)]MCB5942042.1 DNA polymerase I [bacterium 210820-DFI.6.52]MZL70549.1 DNA polymerase I [Bittarella massiliensis (ex Durand et al. 2017)]MZL80227.1 DNA polymerase I [Bittarella massiliensis (ex Durand et al. 2017)]SHG36429.1 DNA polymerase I [Bittarella massiliensis (ex Durand et al. 2017)]
MKFVCIDGNSIVNRAFYGIKLLTTKDGSYTNAIYGFLNILLGIRQEVEPDGIAIAFDLRAPTFRHLQYDQYKAGRKGMPDELAQQLPLLKEILQKMGYPLLAVEGFEADDILGTFARLCREGGEDCVLCTGDRDSYQLIGERVSVRLSTTQKSEVLTPESIRERYGVEPIQMIEVKALMGDSSDNIPGVAGIGEKTALSLIAQFGTLDGVYEHLDDPAIKPGVRAKLEKGRETAYLSRQLAEIRTDVPIDGDLSHYKTAPADEGWLYQTLSRLEMQSLIGRLGLHPDGAAPAPEGGEEAAPLPSARVADALPAGEGPVGVLALEDGRWAAVRGTDVALYPGLAEIAPLLADETVAKWVFDSKALYHLLPEAAGIAFDGMLAAYLLNPTASAYQLEALIGEYGAAPAFSLEEELPQKGELAALMPLLATLQEKLAAAGETELLARIELPLAQVLCDMEETGVAVDCEGIRQYGEMLDLDIAQVQQRIFDRVGRSFNINSPQQLGVALFEDLGLPHGKKTKTGWSTNADVLNGLLGKDPVIQDILDYRSYTKLKSTYVEGLLKVVREDGRIHSRFNQTETRTGRISSTEPNMQNIPVRTPLGSELRKFFVARPGYTLVDADYSQIELRVLAHMADDERMIEAFRSGQDIHTITASQVFGMPLDFVTPQMRRRAKAVNFGIVYGIGAYSLAQDIEVSVAEADAYIKGYLETYQGVRAFMERTVEDARDCGYVTTLYGRRRYIRELASKNKVLQALGKRMAMNSPIQGTAADIIKIAMCRVWERLRDEGLDAKLILQVHDELIVEAREEDAQRVANLVTEEMQGAAALAVPLVVDAHTGVNWYLAKG